MSEAKEAARRREALEILAAAQTRLKGNVSVALEPEQVARLLEIEAGE